MDVNEDFTEDPTVPHAHQCGYSHILGGRIDGYGCGYVFVHCGERPKSNEEYSSRHRCPKCGCGPWYSTVMAAKQGSAAV